MDKQPKEFKISKKENGMFAIFYYYEDASFVEIGLSNIPSGIELDKHYFIGDYKCSDMTEFYTK